MWIDAHCHLADSRFDESRAEVIERAERAGIGMFIQGGVNPQDWQRQRTLADHRWITCFGLHPWHVAQTDDAQLERDLVQLQKELPQARALGELGLDYGPRMSPETHERQRTWFRRQLTLKRQPVTDKPLKRQPVTDKPLAFQNIPEQVTEKLTGNKPAATPKPGTQKTLPVTDKPLVIHMVRAHGDGLAILREHRGRLRGLLHGFTGSAEVARQYVDLGFTLSIGGAFTREGYKKLKAAVRDIPKERLVVESDAPDMAPVPCPHPLNEPSTIRLVAEAVARARGETAAEVLEQSAANLRALFDLE